MEKEQDSAKRPSLCFSKWFPDPLFQRTSANFSLLASMTHFSVLSHMYIVFWGEVVLLSQNV